MKRVEESATGFVGKGLWESLPAGAPTFLFRAVVLLLLWKAVYVVVLVPLGEPDGWMVRKLGETTVGILNLIHGEEVYRVSHGIRRGPENRSDPVGRSIVYRPGVGSDLGIAAPCNGLELMVLSAGFILCFHGHWRRKMVYVVASLAFVFAVNILRCCLLTVIKVGHTEYFTFAHKYLFNLAGYAAVFGVWMRYVRGLVPVREAGL